MFWKRNQKTYFDYFEEQALFILQASTRLEDFFNSPGTHPKVSKEIKTLEQQADKIAHNAYNQLNTAGFILPIDREDILLFLKSLDDVIDYIDDVTEAFIDIYGLQETTPLSRKMAQGISQGSKHVAANCKLMRNPSKNGEKILIHCTEMHRLENEGDEISKEALHQIYADLKANKMPIYEYIAWKDIYSMLEEVTDVIEDFANVSEQYVIKYS